MTVQQIKPGQVWRRRKDGAEVTVSSVDPAWAGRRTVVHQGKRRVYTEYGPFLSKYEFVREGE